MTFEYRDADGDKLTVQPAVGAPYLHFRTSPSGCAVPVDRAEEVVAGVRDAARQASGQQPEAETTLRDRLRRAVCEASGFAWDSEMLEPDEYGDHADAVLAVLAEHEAASRRYELLPQGKDFTPAVGVQDATQPTTDETGPHVRAVEYAVNCLPEDDINANGFEIRVQYRGAGRYAVIRHGEMCLGADGTWDFGVKEYDRGEDWLNAHRFDLDTALRMAREHAPHVTVNGHTVADALRLAAGAES